MFFVSRLYKYNAHPCLAICSQKLCLYREKNNNKKQQQKNNNKKQQQQKQQQQQQTKQSNSSELAQK